VSDEKIEIHIAAFGSELHAAEYRLRERVLREPLGLTMTETDFEADRADTHVVAIVDGTLVGCLILVDVDAQTVKMRQVAVEPAFQNRGIGVKLVEFSEIYALKKGFSTMTLHARAPVVPFYEKLGYQVFGEEFIEVTIPHFAIRKVML
jgi:GNAT superfamily N-acetyltransferase